jgi:hypothetical protein
MAHDRHLQFPASCENLLNYTERLKIGYETQPTTYPAENPMLGPSEIRQVRATSEIGTRYYLNCQLVTWARYKLYLNFNFTYQICLVVTAADLDPILPRTWSDPPFPRLIARDLSIIKQCINCNKLSFGKLTALDSCEKRCQIAFKSAFEIALLMSFWKKININ